MKKTFLALTFLSVGMSVSNAQISNGGLPLSTLSGDATIAAQTITPVVYKAPALEAVKAEDARATMADPKPYRVGILVPTNVSFPESGNMITLANGKRIWRAQINVTNAPALVLYYDQFHLPAGVNFYLSNGNGKQILGAFTEQNNSDDGLFATQDVQGDVVNLELDMEAYASVSDIKLHVNNAAYLYRGVANVNAFAGNDDNGTAAKPTGDFLAGSSSTCEVNAICPQGASFPQQRKAVTRILMPVGGGAVGLCSGTLVNNTAGDCTPYILTATHCESTNSKVNSTYSQFIFYFNFETPDCAGASTAPSSQTMIGATFVARANYNENSSAIIGDFLLMKLKTKVPVSYDAYFAGWNRSTTNATGNTYIGFHHPSGDEKKLAIGTSISSNGTFNQIATAGTHWEMHYTTGGVEEGSSGSSLFDQNGRIIGDLSGGESVQACSNYFNVNGDTAILGQEALYSKFSRNWEYPEGLGATDAELKPWLDPTNVGVTTTDALAAAATCNSPATTTAISTVNNLLADAISIYPNPVSTGVVRMKVNLAKSSDLNVTFYDVSGARKAVYNLTKVTSGEYIFDIGAFANGTYLMKINTEDATTSRKVMLIH